MPVVAEDMRWLVELLGDSGATVGLEKSHINVTELRELAKHMGISMPAKASRKEIVNSIVAKASVRIDRSVAELLSMDAADLLAYFESVKPAKSELLAILSELDFHPGSEAQKSLYKYAARQIAETGMFQRVAQNTSGAKSELS